MDDILQIPPPGILHHTLKERSFRAENTKLYSWDSLSHFRKRVDSQIQSVSLHQRSVVHDHKTRVPIVTCKFVRPRGTERKYLAVRRIHHHGNFLRRTATRRKDSLA